MERRKHPYTIYRRPTSKARKNIYYAKFRDNAGDYERAVSTTCTSRDAAVRWCERRLVERARTPQLEDLTFADYAADFWSPADRYAESRSARGYAPSLGYLDVAEGNTRLHLVPEFGELPLREITPALVDVWAVRLYQQRELAGATVNKLIYTLRVMLDQAVAERRIGDNPTARVRPVAAGHRKPGRLEAEEIVRLLATPAPWGDFRLYAVNLLAAATGARMGECRGLLVEDVKADRVEIRHSWEEGHGIKAPKYNSIRTVRVCEAVAAALSRVIRDTAAESIVFYGSTFETPVSKSWIEHGLYRALANIGIDARARGIVFHSHRHALNSELRAAGIPDPIVQSVTGHRTDRMTDHYSRFTREDQSRVVEVQRNLLTARA